MAAESLLLLLPIEHLPVKIPLLNQSFISLQQTIGSIYITYRNGIGDNMDVLTTLFGLIWHVQMIEILTFWMTWPWKMSKFRTSKRSWRRTILSSDATYWCWRGERSDGAGDCSHNGVLRKVSLLLTTARWSRVVAYWMGAESRCRGTRHSGFQQPVLPTGDNNQEYLQLTVKKQSPSVLTIPVLTIQF